MKLLPSLCLAASLTFTSAFAGSLGGPAPFQNGSPLSSGTDGTYNASIRGSNLSGVFRFTISGGSQGGDITSPTGTQRLTKPRASMVNPDPAESPNVGSLGADENATFITTGGNYSTRGNSWVAWYEGVVTRGMTDVAITDGAIAGVLQAMNAPSGAAAQPANDNTGIALSTTSGSEKVGYTWSIVSYTTSSSGNSIVAIPVYGWIAGNGTSSLSESYERLQNDIGYAPGIPTVLQNGEFSGSIQLNSPNGNIKGTGSFVVLTNLGSVTANGSARDQNSPQWIPSNVSFSWRGARVSTTAAPTPYIK